MQVFLILIFIVVGIIFLIGWIISSISESLKESQKNSEKVNKAKEKWGDRVIDSNKSLEDRNDDIIQSHLKMLQTNPYREYYYIDNSVRDCIQEIAEVENKLSVAPNHKYLSIWVDDAPKDWQELKESLVTKFDNHWKKIKEISEKKEELKYKNKYSNLKLKYVDTINQFFNVAERKVSMIDDYGDEDWDALPKEINAVIKKIAKKEGESDYEINSWLVSDFSMPDEYIELKKYFNKSFRAKHSRVNSKIKEVIDFSNMSGIEFETYLSRVLKENGCSNVRGTSTTGDQGADLLMEKDGKTIAIQAKCYSGTVGNKAVQEVVGAVSYYDAEEGWVITNSTYTKSAKQLAQKNNIRLLDGSDLKRIKTILAS